VLFLGFALRSRARFCRRNINHKHHFLLLLIKYFIMYGFAGKHISKNITKCSCFVKNNDTLFIDFEGVFMPGSSGNK